MHRLALVLTFWLAAALCLPQSGVARAEQQRVAIVLSEDTGAYRETGLALASLAGASGIEGVRSFPLTALAEAQRDARLVVAVGSAALMTVLESSPSTPVLAMLVPRDAYERLVARYPGRRVSAVFIDQPLSRQLDLLALAQPARKRIGVVFGPDSQRQQAALQAAATRRGMQLASATVASEREVFPSIDRVLGDADLLFALPDPVVFNAATIQNILLAAYRREVPMLGFSPAYLKAGALLTVYSTPAQMAVSAIEMVKASLAGRPLPPPRHPREYTVAVNRHVARSLGLQIDADGELLKRMRELEAAP